MRGEGPTEETWNFQSSEDILCDTLTMKMYCYAFFKPTECTIQRVNLMQHVNKENVSILVHINHRKCTIPIK